MEYILLDEEGKKQFYEKFEELKDSSNNNGNELSKSFNDYVGDGWHDNPLYEEAMRRNRMIDEDIKKMLNEEKYLKVINDVYDENLVNINDIVKVEFIYSEDDKEEEIIKLTGKYIPNIDQKVQEITLNSPIGKAIYRKKIGDNCFYMVDDRKIKIRIIERINFVR